MREEEIIVSPGSSASSPNIEETYAVSAEASPMVEKVEPILPMGAALLPDSEEQKLLLAPIHRQDIMSMTGCTAEQNIDEYLSDVAAKIKTMRHNTLLSCIDIGDLLIRVKELSVKHGRWMNWLKDNVNMSYKMAQRYIRLAKAYQDRTLVSNLGLTQALVLLAIDDEVRAQFIKIPHDVNGKQKFVSEMTISELRNIVRNETKVEEEKESQEFLPNGSEYTELSNAIMNANDNLQKIVASLNINKSFTAVDEFRHGICKLYAAVQSCMELINSVQSEEAA